MELVFFHQNPQEFLGFLIFYSPKNHSKIYMIFSEVEDVDIHLKECYSSDFSFLIKRSNGTATSNITIAANKKINSFGKTLNSPYALTA